MTAVEFKKIIRDLKLPTDAKIMLDDTCLHYLWLRRGGLTNNAMINRIEGRARKMGFELIHVDNYWGEFNVTFHSASYYMNSIVLRSSCLLAPDVVSNRFRIVLALRGTEHIANGWTKPVAEEETHWKTSMKPRKEEEDE